MTIAGIIASVVSYMVIGIIWYSETVFGPMWMKLTGVKPNTKEKEAMNLMYGLTALSAFFLSVVLNYLMIAMDVRTLTQALFLGSMCWFGFTLMPTNIMNMYQQKSWKITAIDAGYQGVCILCMSALIFYLL